MKNFASVFIKTLPAIAVIAILCALSPPAPAHDSAAAASTKGAASKITGVRAEILPATTFHVRVTWDMAHHHHSDPARKIDYIVQLAEFDTAWAQGDKNNVKNNVLPDPNLPFSGGQMASALAGTDAASPTGVTFFDGCRTFNRRYNNAGNLFSGTVLPNFVCNGTETEPFAVSYRGFTEGTKYKVRIRGHTAVPGSTAGVNNGLGEFSDEVVFTIPTADNAPGTLTINAATEIGAHAFTANWTAATNAESYYLRWRTAETSAGADDQGLWQNAAGDDTADCNDADTDNDDGCGKILPFAPTSYTLTGLNSATDYDYEIRAVNMHSAGAWDSAQVTLPVSTVSRLKPPLVVKHGSDNTVLTLQPAFEPETLAYAVTLNNADSIKVTAATESSVATMKIGVAGNEAEVATTSVISHEVGGLTGGTATVNVTVTAEDTMTTRTYVITVTLAAARMRAEFLGAQVSARKEQPTPNLRILWNAPTVPAAEYAIAVQMKATDENWKEISGITAIADFADDDVQQLPPDAQIAVAVDDVPNGMRGVDITRLPVNEMYDVRLIVFGRLTRLNAIVSGDTVEVVAEQVARTNNNISTLSDLVPRTLIMGTEMTPAWSASAPADTVYEVVYNRGAANFWIAVTLSDSNATATGFGNQSSAAGFTVTGVTTHLVVVTAEDGVATTTYTVRAINPLDAFTITSITPTAGGDALTFSPAADRAVFAYTAGTVAALTAVPSAVDSLDFDFACMACGSVSTIGVRGFGDAVSFRNADTPTVPLKFGENHIDIGYANNKEPVVYTFTVIREQPTAPPPALTFDDPAVSALGAHGFSVNWLGESDASGYAVRWRTAATTDDVAAGPWQNAGGIDADCNDAANDAMCGEMIDGATTVAYAISGLLSGTTYDYSARAVNSAGVSANWSESEAAVTTPDSADSSLRVLTAAAADGADLITDFDAATLNYALGMIAIGETELAITAAINEITAAITQVTLNGVAIDPAPAGAEFSVDISGVTADGLTPAAIVISITAGDATATTNYTITFTRMRPFASDANRDGEVDINDGLLITRYLLGFRGGMLTADIAETTAAAEIEAHLKIEVNARDQTLDVNGDGITTTADGILITRHLLGVTEGEGLTAGQVDAVNPPNNVHGNVGRALFIQSQVTP